MIELFTEFRARLQNRIINEMQKRKIDIIPLTCEYETVDEDGCFCLIRYNSIELEDYSLIVDYSVKLGSSVKNYEDEFWVFSCNEMFEIVKDIDSFFGGWK